MISIMMHKNRLRHNWGIFSIFLFFQAPLIGQIFVDDSANGLNNGTSWANAYTDLQEALQLHGGEEIWVAQGTYYPVSCTFCQESERSQFFNLLTDTQLYGGFSGNETSPDQRDIANNPTILSGDIGAPLDSLDNSYRIMLAENSSANTILDGLIFEEANANGGLGLSLGGALYLDANPSGRADIQIHNCIFSNNYAGGGGAIGVWFTGKSDSVRD